VAGLSRDNFAGDDNLAGPYPGMWAGANGRWRRRQAGISSRATEEQMIRFTGRRSKTAAGIIAGALGGWLADHWLWAPACGALVIIGMTAGAEALKARRADSRASEGEQDPRRAFTFGDNARVSHPTMAGRDIDQSAAFISDRRRTTVFRGVGGTAAIVAFLAFGGALGGTVFIAQGPRGAPLSGPRDLAAGGNQSSPEGAAEGFMGDYFLGDTGGACNYVLPDEVQSCLVVAEEPSSSLPAGTTFKNLESVRVIPAGNIVGVVLAGKFCTSGHCRSVDIPVACEKLGNTWYVDFQTQD
jgi:F0F1-type ATP synthase assembly protein I